MKEYNFYLTNGTKRTMQYGIFHNIDNCKEIAEMKLAKAKENYKQYPDLFTDFTNYVIQVRNVSEWEEI